MANRKPLNWSPSFLTTVWASLLMALRFVQNDIRVLRERLRILVVLGLIVFAGTNLQAQWIVQPSVSQNNAALVTQFLTDDWQRNSANRSNSKQTFESKGSTATEVSFAFLLNRLQHNEKREALQVVNQLTTDNPDSLDGWLIKAHLNALLDNFDRAMIDLRSTKMLLVGDHSWDADQKLEAYRRIGRIFGYLQGPAGKRINPDTLAETETEVTDRCTAAELAAFTDGRDRILQRFNNVTKVENDRVQKELEKQAAENETLDLTLTSQNELLGKTTDHLLAEQERLRTEGSQRLADLAGLASPLEARLSTLTTQVNAISYDLQLLYTDLFYAQNASARYRTSTWFLQDQIRSAEIALANSQANANATANQLRTVQAQYKQTRNAYNMRNAALQQEVKKMNATRIRNQKRLAKIAAGPKLAAGKKQAISSRLEALTSYVELPVELYRQQLLDAIEKK